MSYFYQGRHYKPNPHLVKIKDFLKSLPYRFKRTKERIIITLIKTGEKLISLIDYWDIFYDGISLQGLKQKLFRRR